MLLWKTMLCSQCLQKIYRYNGYMEETSHVSAQSSTRYYHRECWYTLFKEQGIDSCSSQSRVPGASFPADLSQISV
jgi:hypothetical protein